MSFQPNVSQKIAFANSVYAVAEHPSAPGMPYGQEGRQATVYQLVAADGDNRALKAFKPRFRVPALVALTGQMVKYADLPGLAVCHRQILTRQRNKQLLEQHPDLQFAVLMPWIEGPTWMEVMLAKDDPVWDSFVPQHSTALANALAQILTGMEQCGIAHCDLSASNVLLPALVESSPNTSAIELVDIEELYAANLAQPNALPGGSDGYAHKTAVSGLWSADADRFSGAVLIAEMLGWCDARVRRAAYGEQFFDPSEMQRDTERYRLLRMALKDCWSDPIAKTFERAWQSGQLSDCPSLAEWATRLREQTAGTRASVRATAALFNLRRDSKTGAAAHIVAQLDTDERVAPGEEGIALAQQFVARSAQREQEGDLDSAVADMHRALDLAPRGSALKQELAIALTELVNRQERMAELNPLVIQAKGFQNAGQWKQAATLYRELVNRASTSLQQVEWQQAYERCASEAELNALFDQGRLAFQQHRLEAAEEIWTEVVRRRPRYAQNGIQAATLLAQVFAERKGVQPGLFQQPLSNIGTFAAAAILGVFCVLVVLFSLLVFSQSKSETVRTECWLGVSGTKASITVKGSQAVQKCEDIADVRIVMPIVGTSYAEWRLVALDTAPRDSIFCQVEISGLRYEVRDQQTAIPPTVMGPSLCKWLDQLKATGATPGRPKIVPTAIATPRPTNPTPQPKNTATYMPAYMPTPTNTSAGTQMATVIPSAMPTCTPTPTGMATHTPTPTGTPTATIIPSITPTPTPTRTNTPTPTSTPTLTPIPPPPSPGGKIAFTTARDVNFEIYVMNADGSNPRRLTNNLESDYSPAWSPDGRLIAFTCVQNNDAEICVMNADGTNLRRLTNSPAGDARPDWSPTGTMIAFTSMRDGNTEIYVMNADGTNLRRLTNDPRSDERPRWSPDGKLIVFSSSRDGNSEIYVMNPDGSNPRRLTNHPASDNEPAWSPDGRFIAFTSRRDGNEELYVMNADGTNLRRLTNSPAFYGEPAWSPAGTMIAFTSIRDGNRQIYVINADGTNLRRLTSHGAENFGPAWSP